MHLGFSSLSQEQWEATQGLHFAHVTLAIVGTTDSRGQHGSGDPDEMTTREAQVNGDHP